MPIQRTAGNNPSFSNFTGSYERSLYNGRINLPQNFLGGKPSSLFISKHFIETVPVVLGKMGKRDSATEVGAKVDIDGEGRIFIPEKICDHLRVGKKERMVVGGIGENLIALFSFDRGEEMLRTGRQVLRQRIRALPWEGVPNYIGFHVIKNTEGKGRPCLPEEWSLDEGRIILGDPGEALIYPVEEWNRIKSLLSDNESLLRIFHLLSYNIKPNSQRRLQIPKEVKQSMEIRDNHTLVLGGRGRGFSLFLKETFDQLISNDINLLTEQIKKFPAGFSLNRGLAISQKVAIDDRGRIWFPWQTDSPLRFVIGGKAGVEENNKLYLFTERGWGLLSQNIPCEMFGALCMLSFKAEVSSFKQDSSARIQTSKEMREFAGLGRKATFVQEGQSVAIRW